MTGILSSPSLPHTSCHQILKASKTLGRVWANDEHMVPVICASDDSQVHLEWRFPIPLPRPRTFNVALFVHGMNSGTGLFAQMVR